MKKIRILYIVKSGDFGGVQSHLINLIENLNRYKFNISVCIPTGVCTEKLKDFNIKIINIDFIRYKINILYDLISFIKIFIIIKKGKYDIVHLHSSKPGVLGRIAAKTVKVKCIIYTPHLFHFRESFNYFQKILFMNLERLLSSKFTDMVISVSNKSRDEVIAKKIIRPDKIITIPNGINPALFNPNINTTHRNKKRKELGIPETKDAVVIGMIARLMPQKAPKDFLIAAASILKKVQTGIYFILAGDGILKQKLIRKQKELKIEDRFYLLGSRNDIPDLLETMDIFVITSLWEGLPITILEAMASGLPIIATNISGNNEIVIDGVTGMLFPRGNINVLTKKMMKLIQDPACRARMGKAGRRRVEENYHVKKMAFRTENLYLNLLKKNYR